jgi:hypothetical protein
MGVDRIGSGSCPTVGSGTSAAEPSASAARGLFNYVHSHLTTSDFTLSFTHFLIL